MPRLLSIRQGGSTSAPIRASRACGVTDIRARWLAEKRGASALVLASRDPGGDRPEDFAAIVRTEHAKLGGVIRTMGLKMD